MSGENKLKGIYKDLLLLAKENDPQTFCAAFMGTVANVIGNLPKEYFEQMVKVEPCGRVGCDCHLGLQLHGSRLLRLLREDWENNKPEETEVC